MGLSPERRFDRYCDGIANALAHADREQPARRTIKGLMLPGKRKSIEPMAAQVQPDNLQRAFSIRVSQILTILRIGSTLPP